MSSRLTRTLLKLYPRRVRDRYGEELLALEDELSTRGEFSRMRLIRDMLAGALPFWPSSQRARLIAGVVCLGCGLALAAVITGGFGVQLAAHQPRPAARSTAQAAITQKHRHAPTVTGHVSPYTTCYVSAGSPCSSTPCTQFTSATPLTRAVTGGRTPSAHRSTRHPAMLCDSSPHGYTPPPAALQAIPFPNKHRHKDGQPLPQTPPRAPHLETALHDRQPASPLRVDRSPNQANTDFHLT